MLGGKTQVPRQTVALVRRDGLLSALKQGIHRKLTLVEAPTGYGKSTLLGQFYSDLGADGALLAWINLDESDASAERLIRTLAGAWPRDRGADDVDCARLLQESDGDLLVAQALCSLCPASGKRAVVFLDNFQRAEGDAARRFLSALIDYLPPTCHLVVATCCSPAISVDRLRAQGQINEIGMADLRFSDEEAGKLLVGLNDVTLINSELEGWPVAIQLLALALVQGKRQVGVQDLQGFVDAELAGFIRSEVLIHVPDAARELLLETAILEEVSPELANVLCERTDCGQLLQELSEASLCVEFRSDSELAYRQHRAIAKYWRGRLLSLRGKAGVDKQHQRAANWLLEHGHIRAAARHLAEIGDFESVARVVEERGAVRIALVHGFPELASLIALLPIDVISKYPRLLIARAWVAAKAGDTRAARHWYGQVSQQPEALSSSDPLSSEALFVDKMMWTVFEQHALQAVELQELEEKLVRAPSDDPWFAGWVRNLLCIMHTRRGDLARAEEDAKRALENYGRAGSVYGAVFMHLHFSLLGVVGGRLTDAEKAAEYSFDLALKHFADDEGLLGIIDFMRGRIAYERHDLDRARTLLQPAMARVEHAETWVEVYALGTSALARVIASAGDISGALTYLDATRELGRSRSMPRLIWSAECCRAEMLMLAKEPADPRDRAETLRFLLEGSGSEYATWFERDRAAVAKFRLALGESEASQLVSDTAAFAANAQRQGRNAAAVEASILIARHYFSLGQSDEAIKSFLCAVELAAPERMLRPFVEDGEAVVPIVRSLIRSIGICAIEAQPLEFIMEILSTLSPVPYGHSGASAVFTEKELDVLSLLLETAPPPRVLLFS